MIHENSIIFEKAVRRDSKEKIITNNIIKNIIFMSFEFFK